MAYRQIDFVREASDSPNYFCQDLQTSNILYYLEVEPRKLTLHLGENTGPVIATCDLCEEKHGFSKIHQDSATTIVVEHTPRRLFLIRAKTSFSFYGKKYYWRGQNELFDVNADKLIAQYHSSPIESKVGTVGQLLMIEMIMQLRDLVIMTAFVVLVRSNKFKDGSIPGVELKKWKILSQLSRRVEHI